jgi:hypothetical protein
LTTLDPDQAAPAVPPSSPRPRDLRLGLGLLALGVLSAFFLMSQDAHLPFGVGLGILAICVAAAGLCECLGLLRSSVRSRASQAGSRRA